MIILGSLDISPLLRASGRFSEALDEMEDDLDRDGAIQRFEYSFELSWKTLKKILEYNGLSANNPRTAFRLAAKEGYIDDPLLWFSFLEKRNLTSLTYKEEVAKEIAAVFPQFKESLKQLISKISKL